MWRVLVGTVCVAVVATACGVSVSSRRELSHKPNIVVLMTDDQTAPSLSAMPHVQALLMRYGTTFDQHFASYPLCCPARATYFTGQYSHNHGVTYNDGPTGGYHAFHDRIAVVPEALRRDGYTTIHIGKYLNGYGLLHPRAVPPGWDDWHGSVDPSTYSYYNFTLNHNGRLERFHHGEYQTNVYSNLASLAIRREARTGKPFFLDVAFLAPHAVQRETSGLDPIDARAAGVGRHGIRFPVPERRDRHLFDNEPVPDSAAFDEADVSDKPLNIRLRNEFTVREAGAIQRNYQLRLAALQSVDRAVVKIVHTLASVHRLRDTYIVFVSDNGYFHGEHRVPFGKYLPYEPSIHIPLVVRGPGVAEGVHSLALTDDVDLPATILDLTHAKPPRELDGHSLRPLLEGRPARWHRRAVLLESGANDAGAPVYSGLRTERWKYVEYTDGERELYDLRHDPEELVNIAGQPQVRAVQAGLARRLAVARDCRGRTCP
jgi:N-acetylglucosamine-6-sulfatase